MKILISHRYYWPDTPPYGLMLRVIGRRLSEAGHQVSVFSTSPSYHGTGKKANPSKHSDEIIAKRVRVLDEKRAIVLTRPLNAIWYAARLFFEITTQKPDIVTASTFPPIVAALSAGIACKLIGSKFIYHLMDVYPEVAYIQKKQNFLYRVLQRLDTHSTKLASQVVVLSSDMKASLMDRGIDSSKVSVLNNIEIHDDQISDISYDQLLENHKIERRPLMIGFAGNIGNFQGLDYIAKIIEKTKNNPNISYLFMGEGRFKKNLERRLADLIGSTVFFLGHHPITVARTFMSGVDLNIVSLSPGVAACSFPSKTITIASEGGAFLILDEPNSSLTDHILSNGAGLAFGYDQIDKASSQLDELSVNTSQIKIYQQGSKKLYSECFSEENILNQWVKLIENLQP